LKLFDKETGQLVEIPAGQLTQALKSGRYGVRADEQVVLRDEIGRPYDVDPQHLVEALDSGYRPESADEQHKRELEEKYGGVGHGMAAAGLAAARGVSLGLSDKLFTGLEMVDPKDIKGLREQWGTLSTGTEVGTGVLSLFLGGGLGTAGALGRAAGVAKTAKSGSKLAKALGGATIMLSGPSVLSTAAATTRA